MASPVTAEMGNGCEGMAHHAPDKQKPDRSLSCAVACAAIPALLATLPAEAIFTKADTFTRPTRHLTGMGIEAELRPPRSAPVI